MIIIKTKREIDKMRNAGRLVGKTHDFLKKLIVPGITTKELDQAAEEYIISHNGIPAFKGYHGFPSSICTSVNEEVVHGIPGLKKLKNGDIISIDIGTIVEGYCGDGAVTYAVGDISNEAQKLIKVTEKSFFEGVKFAKKGNRLSDISHVIQNYVEKNGFSVVRDFVGHGIGQNIHEAPEIPNFGPPGLGPRLVPGMILAVEPMVNQGSYHVKILEDNWTTVTVDNKLSAHYEHTVLITDGEPELLTVV